MDFFDILDDIGAMIDMTFETMEDIANDVETLFREIGDDIRKDIEEETEEIPVVNGLVRSGFAVGDMGENVLETAANAAKNYHGQVVEGWPQLDKADHIYIDRGFYSHHGLYLGNGQVMHYAEDYGRICVHKVSFYEFAEGNVVRKLNKIQSPMRYSADEVIARAYGRYQEEEYHLLFNNCENFVRWCRFGSNDD